jgi:DNA-binding transcriptional ArsR family regulator
MKARAQAASRRAASRASSPPALDVATMLAHARQASDLLKALSHEVRLMILCFLMGGEKSVGEIEKLLKLRQPAISQQLARLRADGLVETRRHGKSIYYSVARREVREVIDTLHDAFCGPRKAR